MSMLMLVVQGASVIMEAIMGYLFLGMLSEECREKFLKHKVYLGFWVLFLGTQIYYNKKIVFFSYLFLFTIILFTWLSVVIIVKEQKWIHFLLICIFNSILTLFDFLGAFAVVWFHGNKISYEEFLFHTTSLKIMVLFTIRVIVTLFMIGAELFIRKNHIEIQLEYQKTFGHCICRYCWNSIFSENFCG